MAEHPEHVQMGYNEIELGLSQGAADLVTTGRKRVAAAGLDPDKVEREVKTALAAATRQTALAATAGGQQTPPSGRRAPSPSQTTS